MRATSTQRRGERRTVEILSKLYYERERHFRREVETNRLQNQPFDGEQSLSVGF